MGMFNLMCFENLVETTQLQGRTSEYWGINKISSNVSPYLYFMLSINNYTDFFHLVKRYFGINTQIKQQLKSHLFTPSLNY